MKRGEELAETTLGTEVVHGPLRRIELGGVDSNKVVRNRILRCTNSDRVAKALLTAWNSQMTVRVCEIEGNLLQIQVILEAVKGDMLEDGTVSELDSKLAGLVHSELVFPLEKVRNSWEAIEQRYDDISGTLFPEELGASWKSGRNHKVRIDQIALQRAKTISDCERNHAEEMDNGKSMTTRTNQPPTSVTYWIQLLATTDISSSTSQPDHYQV